MSDYDVITFGETMLRLTPPHYQRIEQATRLEIEVGGSESNTAVGLVRLGLKTAWLSRLPSNPLGRLTAGTLAGYGVDTSHVVWAAEDRMGLYFLERGKAPRASRVIYDRKESAVSRMKPDELPTHLFHPDGARLLHLSGITPALSPDAANTTRLALELAKKAGWLVSFDLNYRAKLWDVPAARRGCEPFFREADILFLPLRDAVSFFDLNPQKEAGEACHQLSVRYPEALIVITAGSDGAIACRPSGQRVHQPAFPAEEVGRLGTGDAFTAGFLFAYLEKGDLDHALRWGAAAAAVKYTIPGDIPLIEKEEIENLLAAESGSTAVSR